MSQIPAAGAAPVTAVLLAAGRGTRMKSRIPKALHPILGKPMACHVLDICRRIGLSRLIVVIGHGAESVREALGPGVEYVVQAQQKGTGDAVRTALPLLEGTTGPVLILQADNVL